jgi:hypothetical protein
VGLKSFLERYPHIINQLFPTDEECKFSAKEVKEKISFSGEESEANTRTKKFFLDYIDVVENRKEGVYIKRNV